MRAPSDVRVAVSRDTSRQRAGGAIARRSAASGRPARNASASIPSSVAKVGFHAIRLPCASCTDTPSFIEFSTDSCRRRCASSPWVSRSFSIRLVRNTSNARASSPISSGRCVDGIRSDVMPFARRAITRVIACSFCRMRLAYATPSSATATPAIASSSSPDWLDTATLRTLSLRSLAICRRRST
ncbi:hypothetical protein BST28156_05358 [Burkholderia stagnalis]|nr:hypothetical protein BST28156_05358 [Burkholderia stagnalis]